MSDKTSEAQARVAAYVAGLEQRGVRGENVEEHKRLLIAMIDAELQRRWLLEAHAARARRRARARGWR